MSWFIMKIISQKSAEFQKFCGTCQIKSATSRGPQKCNSKSYYFFNALNSSTKHFSIVFAFDKFLYLSVLANFGDILDR